MNVIRAQQTVKASDDHGTALARLLPEGHRVDAPSHAVLM
jgi:hypothetical protein